MSLGKNQISKNLHQSDRVGRNEENVPSDNILTLDSFATVHQSNHVMVNEFPPLCHALHKFK